MYASSALSVKVTLSDTTKPVKGRKILVISVEVFSKTKGILLSLVLFIHLLIMIKIFEQLKELVTIFFYKINWKAKAYKHFRWLNDHVLCWPSCMHPFQVIEWSHVMVAISCIYLFQVIEWSRVMIAILYLSISGYWRITCYGRHLVFIFFRLLNFYLTNLVSPLTTQHEWSRRAGKAPL